MLSIDVFTEILLGCSLAPRGDGYRITAATQAVSPGCSLAPRGDGYEELIEPRCIVNRCSLAPRGDGYIKAVAFWQDFNDAA